MSIGSLDPLLAGAGSDHHAARGLQRLKALNATAKSDGAARDRSLREAATDFEAVFLGQMLAPMFEGLKTDGPFGGGNAEEIFRSMMVDEMGTAIARSGGIGIADAVYQKLLALQEA